MNSRLLTLVTAGFIFGSIAVTANADSGQIGRLKDGTAYRTDNAGNQLSDYIAELEVTNAELRRQLTESESTAPTNAHVAAAPATGGNPSLSCPACQYTEASQSAAVSTVLANERARCEQQVRALSTEASQAAMTSCEQHAERKLTEAQAELNRKLATLEEENRNISQQLMDTQDQLAALERRDQQRASLGAAPAVAAPATPAPINPVVKRNLNAELATIQNLISSRKTLLDTLRSRRPNISLFPQNLVTKDGTSLDSLRSQIASSGGADSDGRLTQGLNEIQEILKDDIAVLSRLVN